MSKLTEFFSKIDAKTRIFLLVAAVGVIFAVIAIGSKLMSSGGPGSGSANLASAPGGLQSVPGSKLTPEYDRAIRQANALATKRAEMTGGSSVPTLINNNQDSSFSTGTTGNCTTQCVGSDGIGDLIEDINNLVRMGALAQEDADRLLDMAKNNVSINEFAAGLDDLVKRGKVTPEQARRLLEEYKHYLLKASVSESSKMMDDLIKSGKLPLEVANELLALQKQNVTPEQYAAQLARLVKEGKISPETAALLLAQYTKLKSANAAKETAYSTRQMAKAGEITPDVATRLLDLQKQNVPVSSYEAELARLVAAGKMTPAAAAKLVDSYRAQRLGLGPANTANGLATAAEAAFGNDLDNLVKSGKISAEMAHALADLAKKDISVDDYAAQLAKWVKEGKISPEEAKRLLQKYKSLHALHDQVKKLADLQANNAPVSTYAAELKRAVAEGLLSAEAANRLLEEYKAMGGSAHATGGENVDISVPGGAGLLKLQQNLAAPPVDLTAVAPVNTNRSQSDLAQSQAAADLERLRLQKMQELVTKMSSQAQQLTLTWQAQPMVHKEGGGEGAAKGKPGTGGTLIGPSAGLAKAGAAAATNGVGSALETAPPAPAAPMIKGGTILFAVLNTAVNSDYPDSPVMATIVQGKYNGSKVIGRLAMGKNQDRVTLNFTMMDNDDWPTTKPISAFAIDPDTGHTVLASDVNYHYMVRYGSMFASSFIQGYASGVQNAGTAVTNLSGTSVTKTALSPTSKIAVGLGQIGTTWGQAISTYFATPATVKVNSGVAIGILFMGDVASDAAAAPPVVSTKGIS